MGRPFHQLPPPVPTVGHAHQCIVDRCFQIARAPQLQATAKTEWKAHIVFLGGLGDGRHIAKRLPKVGDFLIGEVGVE